MKRGFDQRFALMFLVMLTIAAGNTALQSVLPALGRSLGVKDSAVAAAFSVSALLWVLAAITGLLRGERIHRGRGGGITGLIGTAAPGGEDHRHLPPPVRQCRCLVVRHGFND